MDGSTSLAQLLPGADPKLVTLLRTLFTQEHTKELLRLLPPPKTTQATLSKDDQKRTISLFTLLHAILFHANDQQFDMLNTLSFGPQSQQLFRALWQQVQGHPIYRSYVELAKDHLSEPAKEPEFWGLFTLFVLLFSHMMTTMSDEEFLQGSAIPVEDAVVLIAVLRTMLSRVFRADFQVADSNVVVGGVTFYTFKVLLVKLGKHLHDRDARRKFCPPGHWITPIDLNLKNVSVQFLDMFDTRDPIDEDELQRKFRVLQEGQEEDLIDYLTAPKPPSVAMTSVTQRQAENAITLLKNVPFMAPFEDRVNVFAALVNRDRQFSLGKPLAATIRRTHVFEDSFQQLGTRGIYYYFCSLGIFFRSFPSQVFFPN